MTNVLAHSQFHRGIDFFFPFIGGKRGRGNDFDDGGLTYFELYGRALLLIFDY